MKKTLICSLLAIATANFANEINDDTAIQDTASSPTMAQLETTIKTPKAMNALPLNKTDNEDKILAIDQPKQAEELVGSGSGTWTPAYLKVQSYKNCLGTQEYRGWEGLCMPPKQPENCPNESWSKLQEMNLVPCAKDVS